LDGHDLQDIPQYEKLLPKTRKDYDSALRLVSQYTLKNARSFGTLDLKSINPGAADRLFAKLKKRSDGGERARTAILCVTVCKRAWNVARRSKPTIVPSLNPFQKMELEYHPKPTRAVTHDDLMRFVKKAD
jgi:hypothetical protein